MTSSEKKEPTTKEKILEESIKLFANKGFHGVSIREIARTVGIKESSIYNHFASKESILDTIFDQFQTEMETTVPSEEYLSKVLDGVSVEEFWRRGMSNFASRTTTDRMGNVTRIIMYEMFRNERARDLAISELFTRQQEAVRMAFGVMESKGMIGDVDIDALADAYSYAMLSMQLEWGLRRSWGFDVGPVEDKMIRHIRFISDFVEA